MDTFIFPNQTRNRAWRRWQNRKNAPRKTQTLFDGLKPEKNWKLLYTRRVKAYRAKQLGSIYPLSENGFYAEWFD